MSEYIRDGEPEGFLALVTVELFGVGGRGAVPLSGGGGGAGGGGGRARERVRETSERRAGEHSVATSA